MRKGWTNLSDDYRKRLARNGITEQSYNAGASLKKARSHDTPQGVSIGEKRYEFLVGLARKLNWADVTPKEIINAELQRGTDPRWLRDRLNTRIKDTKQYRGPKDKGPGFTHWQNRRLSVSVELYWYH